MKKFTFLCNEIFIKIILSIFYFSIIGSTSLILRVVQIIKIPRTRAASYWSVPQNTNLAKEYFKSSY